MSARVRSAVLAALLGLGLAGSAASGAAPLQQVEGSVLVVTGGHVKSGPYPTVSGERPHNGLAEYVFEVDPRTRGKQFSVQGLQGGTASSQDAYGITFYDDRAYQIGTVNESYGGFGPEVGRVPEKAAYALVYTDFGLNMQFRYRVG